MAQDRRKSGEGRRVLVVDDDDFMRKFLCDAVTRQGHEVEAADCLEVAWEALGASAFDVALIDQELPDGNGLDLLAEIRSRDLDTRVVVVTGHGELQAAIRALRLGATDYVEKPFKDLDALRDCLDHCFVAHDEHRDRRRLVDELRETNRTLEALTVRDPLTRVFNHAYFHELLQQELVRCGRHELECSILLIELDGLKALNNELGHATGDRLLKTFAGVLDNQDASREGVFSRRTQDVVARFSGSRFALLLPETSKKGAAVVAERLRESIKEYSFDVLELPRQTIAIGIASYPSDGRDRADLLGACSTALRAAKYGGLNRMVAYAKRLEGLRGHDDSALRVELELLDALDRSIAGGEFNFVYQPIVWADRAEIFAYEALCRPRNCVFPHPGVLIETAERAGRVGPLGRALRQRAIEALNHLPSGQTLFVNIHPLELFDTEFSAIESFLAAWTDQVVFEITEVASLRDYERVCQLISRLKAAGFGIALDDLGSGYSGLNSLAMLRPDFVKLDMDLVRGVTDPRGARLIRHIVEFANDEGMKVVAEGVETEEERGLLVDIGCHLLQGFLFSRGRPLDEILSELGLPAPDKG